MTAPPWAQGQPIDGMLARPAAFPLDLASFSLNPMSGTVSMSLTDFMAWCGRLMVHDQTVGATEDAPQG